jgi:hypothetical protein
MIPQNIQVEMAMTCQDKNKNYCFSFYEFEVYDHLQKKQYVKTLRLPVKLIKIDENIYKIEYESSILLMFLLELIGKLNAFF